MQTFYILAWFFLSMSVLITTLLGVLDLLAVVVFGLIATGLILTMVFWPDHLKSEEQTIGRTSRLN